MGMDITVSPLPFRKYGDEKHIYCHINQEQRSWQCGIDIIGMYKCLDLSLCSLEIIK